MPKHSGFTLIELIVVIAVTGVLFSTMWPSFSVMLDRNRATTAINWLVSVVHFTRQAAINHGTTVTLCAADEALHCQNSWHDGVIVFVDYNANARIDDNDKVLLRSQPPHAHGTIAWRAFRNKKYLQYSPMGYTRYQNGNFVYCPRSEDPRFRRQLVINLQGRVRVAHYRDENGHTVDRRGKRLRC